MYQYLFMFILSLILLFFILTEINFLNISNSFNNKEPFNTYFRQTVRPHVRNVKNIHENVTYHFNTKFKEFGKSLGIFY